MENKKINAGVLSLDIKQLNKNFNSIDDLIGFASRMNSKRGFLFVSKILGKHTPLKPSKMRQVYDILADELGSDKVNNTLVVGMAETATGLGAGVADSLATKDPSSFVYYQHTTRHKLQQKEWFRLEESHSHAVSHIVYEPSSWLKDSIEKSSRLVLIDDEISTGKTLVNLIRGYQGHLKNLKKIQVVALVSWLDSEKKKWFESEVSKIFNEKPPIIEFISLAEGSFTFEKDKDFEIDLPANTDKGIDENPSREDLGRLGIQMPLNLQLQNPLTIPNAYTKSENTLAIVGTGEHLYLPFLYAEKLEKSGVSVTFQSTTRSPVLVDSNVIMNKIKIPMHRENGVVEHYIYNLDQENSNVYVIPEHSSLGFYYSHLEAFNKKKA